MNYITIKQVQQGLYQTYLRGTTKPVKKDYLTVLHDFTSKKEAKKYISDNWPELRIYN